MNDLTDDQRALIDEQYSNNSRQSASEHEKSVALKQCVIDTVGFLPADMSDLTPEELQLVGQNCANPGQSKQIQQSFGGWRWRCAVGGGVSVGTAVAVGAAVGSGLDARHRAATAKIVTPIYRAIITLSMG